MRKIQVLLAFITVICLVLITGWAFAGDVKAQGQPFQALQQQINDLKALIESKCDCPITREQLADLIARIEYLESFHPKYDPGFTDMRDGTIRDNDTGLIWLKDASCPELAGTAPSGMANWQTAIEAAAALSGDGTCGLTDGSAAGDWRLPTKLEWEAFMSTVYDYPALVNAAGNAQWSEGDAFNGVMSTVYWSSTVYSSETVWAADMSEGFVREAYKDPGGPGFYVWPVRDAK